MISRCFSTSTVVGANKVLAILLALVVQVAFAQTVWNGKADTRWYVKSAKEFTINTAEELAGFAKLVNEGKNFTGQTVKLGADIALNDTTDWLGWEKIPPANIWPPIGSKNKSFRGTFDGNGNMVLGAYINSKSDFQSLFGYVGSGGKIKNIAVLASYIKGKDCVGGLVGKLDDGEINFSKFIGMVIGMKSVGGLVGENNGTISYSYAYSSIIGEMFVGGLVGRNSGSIVNNYSFSKVTGDLGIGGLIGSNAKEGRIIRSYSIGNVVGKVSGGLVGVDAGTIGRSYYDMQTSMQSGDTRGEGKTTAQMKQKATFIGWDFDKVWGIKSTVNDGYPYFREDGMIGLLYKIIEKEEKSIDGVILNKAILIYQNSIIDVFILNRRKEGRDFYVLNLVYEGENYLFLKDMKIKIDNEAVITLNDNNPTRRVMSNGGVQENLAFYLEYELLKSLRKCNSLSLQHTELIEIPPEGIKKIKEFLAEQASEN
jgi:hypothetical protein